jgi:integrase
MFDNVPVPVETRALTPLDLEHDLLRQDLEAGRAASTRAAYACDGAAFMSWCAARGLDWRTASPEIVATHLSSVAAAGLSPSSLSRRTAGISYTLLIAGVPEKDLPTKAKVVRECLGGIRRRYPKPSRKKSALTTDLLVELVRTCDDSLRGLRDRALLTVGFGLALRRSELVALDVADVAPAKEGLFVTIRRSKTDQEGLGVTLPLGFGSRLRPVASLQNWLGAARIDSGATFRRIHRSGSLQPQRITDGMLALIVKSRAEAAGLDPTTFSGHSLRAGFVTSAAEDGASVFKIMDVSRHKSMDVMRGYIRNAEAFVGYAGDGIL